MTDRPTSSLQM